jgi:hypothetical protein
MPSLKALIITALPRMAFTSRVWLGRSSATRQFLELRERRPFGTFTLDRSCAARVSVTTKMDAEHDERRDVFTLHMIFCRCVTLLLPELAIDEAYTEVSAQFSHQSNDMRTVGSPTLV